MPNEEVNKCSGDCTACENTCSKAPKKIETKDGEKIVSFDKEPTLIDVVNMLLGDEGFKKSVDGSSIVATRILKHSNGQDAVLQIFFHKKMKDSIIIAKEMPKVK